MLIHSLEGENTINNLLSFTVVSLLVLMVACSPPSAKRKKEEPITQPSTQENRVVQRAVLVTGASSGIGRKVTELLASKGFFVYACARKAKDLEELNTIENVQAIRLDVTKPEEIEVAVETIRTAGRGLYGLINNAGITVIAPLIEVSEEEFDFQMNVNVYGTYRVTKAFAPLIIESKGRIAITGSASGTATWGLGGPYSMSKHAIEAFTDVLALELEPFGVKVSLIEPGNYRTNLTSNMRQRLEERGYTSENSLYKDQVDKLLDMGKSTMVNHVYLEEPDDVAEAFLHALSVENPKQRYLVTPYKHEAAAVIMSSIQRLIQLNEDHRYSYERDELVKMMDNALNASH